MGLAAWYIWATWAEVVRVVIDIVCVKQQEVREVDLKDEGSLRGESSLLDVESRSEGRE